MELILVLMLGLAVFVFAFGLGAVKYAQFLADRMVGRKHREAEALTGSEMLPPRWMRGIYGIEAIAPYAKFRAMRRMEALIKYFRTTPLIEDDAARDQVTRELRDLKERWKELSWNEIREHRRY